MPSEVFLPCFIPASQSCGETNFDQNNQGQSDGSFGYGDDPLDFDLLAEYLLEDGTSFGTESPPHVQAPQTSIVSPDLVSTTTPYHLSETPAFNITAANALNHNKNGIAQAVLAPAPHPMSAPPTLTGIAPAPSVAPQQMILHQHKRPRLESNNPQAIQMMHPQNGLPLGIATVPQGKTGRQKSQAQIDRRRERNRILARRTRLRKKFFFESLQKEVMELQRENVALKEIVRTELDADQSKTILDSCKATEDLPDVVLEHCGDPSALGLQDFNLMTSIKESQQCFIITDPSLQDNPIVYASDDFLKLTGYSRDQVLGRNCRFLQGGETNPKKVAQVRHAVANGEDCSVTFINYMADGTAFWNKLFIAALRDAQNNIVNYIGVSVKVAGPEPEDPEAGKLLPGQLSAPEIGANHTDMNINYDDEENSVDADAAVIAIEGAVEKAVAAAPNVNTLTNQLS